MESESKTFGMKGRKKNKIKTEEHFGEKLFNYAKFRYFLGFFFSIK